MPHEILFTETLGNDGSEIVYVKPPEANKVSRLNSSLKPGGTFVAKIVNIFKEVLLPRGYPSTVSEDYIEYQIWDTIQAFCSTIGHTLTTHAILVGVGVGDKEASALSASITWILKDGIGMVSKIAFAWLSGSGFDSDCKKWRLFADVLNDCAMLVELTLLPLVPEYSLQVLCFSSSMKAVVGVAGGSTRAAVTQHQAINENMGDVSAKDGSQETVVNLIACIFGVYLLSHLSESSLVYPVFVLIMFLHLFANYKAVRSLRFKVLNPERFHLVLFHYLTKQIVPSPERIADMESVFLFGGLTDKALTGWKVKLGSSMHGLNLTSNQLRMISNLYKERKFLLVQGSTMVHVMLEKHSDTKDLYQSYFHALMLAIASSFILTTVPSMFENSLESNDSPLKRFFEVIPKMPQRNVGEKLNIEEIIEVDEFCRSEFILFWTQLQSMGWNVAQHQLQGADSRWRGSWGSSLNRESHDFKPHYQ